MTKKSAFTLAEILITLTILGVVAAITIPSVVRNYERRSTVTKVKKFYAALENTFSSLFIVNPDFVSQLLEQESASQRSLLYYNSIIKPYFNIAYDAGNDTEKKETILPEEYNYILSENTLNSGKTYENVSAAKLKDGSTVSITGYDNDDNKTTSWIFYDINGNKKPNIIGKDIFLFHLEPTSRIISPGGSAINKPDTIKENVKNMTSFLSNAEQYSASYIIAYGNMSYLDVMYCLKGRSTERGAKQECKNKYLKQ